MNLETLVSKMMTMNTKARLWHWMTDTAQHHVTFEKFLTQNELLTDSFVESTLGNDLPLNLSEVGVLEGACKNYSLEISTSEIKNYRGLIMEMKNSLDHDNNMGSEELVTILDDVIELSSKTLYLLKLK